MSHKGKENKTIKERIEEAEVKKKEADSVIATRKAQHMLGIMVMRDEAEEKIYRCIQMSMDIIEQMSKGTPKEQAEKRLETFSKEVTGWTLPKD